MLNVLKLATTAAAAVLAFSGVASAADLTKGPYEADGYITASDATCSSLSPSLKVGSPSDTSIEYPGAGGLNMILATPGTTSTTAAGKASTTVCVATAAVPSTGLNGSTIAFKCYSDTTSGPASAPLATITTQFKVGASHSASVKQVTSSSTLSVGTISCKFTSDGSWTLE